MPDATFREEPQEGGTTRYTCVISYATQPDGICGHWSTDFTLFKQHMEQQHQGLLVKAGEPPAPAPPDDPEPDVPDPTPPPPEPEKEPVQAVASESVGA